MAAKRLSIRFRSAEDSKANGLGGLLDRGVAVDIGGGSFPNPLPVSPGSGVAFSIMGGVIEPVVRFRVSISKREAASEIVVSAGIIAPAGLLHLHGERSVVEAVGIFIEHFEENRRA